MSNKIIHKRSSVVTENGTPKIPTSDHLEYGEIAINYASGVETLSMKNADNEIVTLPFKSVIVDQEISAESTNAVSNKAVSTVIGEIEEVVAGALTDLDERVLTLEAKPSVSKVSDLVNDLEYVTSSEINERFNLMSSSTELSFFCIEPVTVVVNDTELNYAAGSNVTVTFNDGDTFTILPTSDKSIYSLNAYPGAISEFYPWLEGVMIFSNILFDMNDLAMYEKWNQGHQGDYHVQYAQYTNCVFWSDNPYISEVTRRPNYTLYYSSEMPLCYSTIPDNTFKAFYCAYNVTKDPNWASQTYKDSFAKATHATQVFSYYGLHSIGMFDMDSSAFNIVLPKDCRGLMFCARNVLHVGVLDAVNTTNFGAKSGSWRDAFGYCDQLKDLYIKNLKVSINVSWSPLSLDSLSFIIDNAANTSAITISLSPYTYHHLTTAVKNTAQAKNIKLELITTNYSDDARFGTMATKEEIPTKVSDLENDNSYTTLAEVMENKLEYVFEYTETPYEISQEDLELLMFILDEKPLGSKVIMRYFYGAGGGYGYLGDAELVYKHNYVNQGFMLYNLIFDVVETSEEDKKFSGHIKVDIRREDDETPTIVTMTKISHTSANAYFLGIDEILPNVTQETYNELCEAIATNTPIYVTGDGMTMCVVRQFMVDDCVVLEFDAEGSYAVIQINSDLTVYTTEKYFVPETTYDSDKAKLEEELAEVKAQLAQSVSREEVAQMIQQALEDYFNSNPDNPDTPDTPDTPEDPEEPEEPTDSIGSITDDNSIVVDETRLENGTYTLRYIDADDNIIDNFNEITSFEINK